MTDAEFFDSLTDDELRGKADVIYQDLIHAAQLVPQSEWHAAVFAALYCACSEMTKRKMPPPTAKVFQ